MWIWTIDMDMDRVTRDQACLQLTSHFFFKFNQNEDILSVETPNIDAGIFFSSLDTSPCPHRITAYLELPLSQLSAFHLHKVLYHFPYRISAFHLFFYYFPGQYDYTWAYHGKVGVLRSFLLWANCHNTNQFFADSRPSIGQCPIWFLSDPRPITPWPCHSVTHRLTNSLLCTV